LWLTTKSDAVALGLNLPPFAGGAFLWLIGAPREGRLFAILFFGSGKQSVSALRRIAWLVGYLRCFHCLSLATFVGASFFLAEYFASAFTF